MMEEELFFEENIKKKKKQYALFKSGELEPGVYSLVVEYRNRQTFNDNIYAFLGMNKYVLSFPSLQLNYNYREDEHFLQKQQTMAKVESNDSEPKTPFAPIQNNQQNLPPSKPVDKQDNLSDQFEDDFEENSRQAKEEEDKENKNNASFHTEESKNSKQSKQVDQKNNQKPNQRITSGNRIRPGERL